MRMQLMITRFAAVVLNATATPTRNQSPCSGHVPERVSLPCRSEATPTSQPKWPHKAKPELVASRLGGRSDSDKCSRALVTSRSASWIGVERQRIRLPLLRWKELAGCHHQVSIGLIQVGVSLPHESRAHCDSKTREYPNRSKSHRSVAPKQQGTPLNNLIKLYGNWG